MPIFNFGSLNIDDVYSVHHIVRPGETLGTSAYRTFPGGKGANQSVALGRAGAQVSHVGKVGRDGLWLLSVLQEAGAQTNQVLTSDEPTGRAIIQVDAAGQNSILLYGGANQAIQASEVCAFLDTTAPGDLILTQNETSEVPTLLRESAQRGLSVVFNPAPMGPEVLNYPLDAVHLLIVNETEAEALAGFEGTPRALAEALVSRYPRMQVLMTLGAEGALIGSADGPWLTIPGRRVPVVDTTAAGDTFVGYFLAARQRGFFLGDALETANRAAAIAVTRPGAATSIPSWNEVILASSTP